MTSKHRIAREVHIVRRPDGPLSADDFVVAEQPLADLAPGEFLIANRLLSIDPVRRVFFANGTAPLNAGLHSFAIGQVLESRHPDYAPGEIVGHYRGLRDLAIGRGEETRKIPVGEDPLEWHMGPLGVGGFFAYVGLIEAARVRPGESVLVSSAAGSVGSLAAQLARLIGCRVVATVGSPDKQAWLTDVAGVERVIDYKRGDWRERLAAALPDGLDVYFDNVGGAQLDAALSLINPHGRVAVCGMVSTYDSVAPFSERAGAWTWRMMTSQVELKSYHVRDHQRLWPAFQRSVGDWLRSGAIRTETQVLDSLEAVPQAFVDLIAGKGLGKTVVRLS
ncbi:MDR family NADP-dependent oxidoreductase [Caulobacter soli]|uniref:MDR family NADP-dependent oxidoreductase n=1 Tax=Caulobacter soli TaxID=2708539 RepID=UPI0013EDC9D9|nr:NADP-dependent oxidoreductase [Caulobacter soli]